MKGFSNLHVKSAVKNHLKDTFRCSHQTTMQIGQIVPLFAEEQINGGTFNIKGRYFSRLAPLVKPTYGDFFFKTIDVFVPYCQLAFDFTAWQDGKTSFEGITPSSRFVDYFEIFVFFANNGSIAGSSSDYDYSYKDTSGTVVYRKFNSVGKYYYKILCSLGYNLPQNADLQTNSSFMTNVNAKKLSALPLLAFAKAYNDYMSQSQRYNTSALTNLLRCIKYNTTTTGYVPGSHTLTYQGLQIIFSNIKICFENNYFTSAWQNPNSALNANESLVNAGSTPGITSDLQLNSNTGVMDTINVSQISASDHKVTIYQRALDFLQAYDNWVRRNVYSGSRDVQQVYSRFGIKPDDYRSHYADVIKTDSMQVQVGDVTSMAETSNQPLGYYAGKGIMSGQNDSKYRCTDYGLRMILGYITLRPAYPYGAFRQVLRTEPLDYYNPEFDGLGAEAISYGEVFTDPKNSISTDTSLDNAVYGFTERYNSYRFFRDKITGDFRKMENNADMNTWHTGRLLTAVRAAGEMVAQSSSMNTIAQTDSEFNRIFNITSGVDQFYITCQFEVDVDLPIMSLNQVPRLGEGDVNVPRNGNEIN